MKPEVWINRQLEGISLENITLKRIVVKETQRERRNRRGWHQRAEGREFQEGRV